MATSQLYDLTHADVWRRFLERIPERDIYFSHGYCKIYEENGEGTAQLFLYEEDNRFVYYPFMLRRINGLPAFRDFDLARDYYDISTPYGYGGPVTNAPKAERSQLLARFSEAFGSFCREKGIVTEFVRFHPLLRLQEDYTNVETRFVRNTVFVDLRLDANLLSEQYKPPFRNRLRKAQKEGLTISYPDPQNVDALFALYTSTMLKTGANGYYFFSREFFENTVRLLRGNIGLVEILYQGRPVSSGLIMQYGRYAHYHLCGSDREFLSKAPNNLLIHGSALWAKERGCEFLHLGGGYTGNDELHRFKSGFNPNGQLDFYIGKKVHIPELYRKVADTVREGLDASGYFPLYRHPDWIAENKPVAQAI